MSSLWGDLRGAKSELLLFSYIRPLGPRNPSIGARYRAVPRKG